MLLNEKSIVGVRARSDGLEIGCIENILKSGFGGKPFFKGLTPKHWLRFMKGLKPKCVKDQIPKWHC